MRIIGIFFTATLIITSYSHAQSKKTDPAERTKTAQTLTILEKGVKRTIKIQLNGEDVVKGSDPSIRRVSSESKEGIIVSFKNKGKVSIEDFEEKYGLKLRKKMLIGYYLFDNLSDSNDMQLIDQIIAHEPNVHTLKPNWKKQNQPR